MKKTTITSAICAAMLSSASAYAAEITNVSMWHHHASQKTEAYYLKAAIQRFNDSQDQYQLVAESIPGGAYTQTVTASANAGKLPCILELDQPLVPNFAWAGFIQPLNGLMNDKILENLNDSGKGVYKDTVYSVGQFDVALSLFTRKSMLEQLDIRIPTVDSPWTKGEFEQVLKTIKASGMYQFPFDIESGVTDAEWPSYAYSPIMISFGGDQIDRTNYVTTDGVINSDESIEFAKWMRSLVEKEFVQRKPADTKGLITGRVGIQYTGSWGLELFEDSLGDDLIVLPVPDFGNGPVIGGGSWHLSMTKSCDNPEGAAAFLNFMMSDQEIATHSSETKTIPTSKGAMNLIGEYKEGGKYHHIYKFSEKFAKLRPATPAYTSITSHFSKAIRDILDGKDPIDALDMASDAIESDIEKNNGYGFDLVQ